MSKITSIGWAANEYGYCVHQYHNSEVVDEYWAGNNVHESQSYSEPSSPNAHTSEELRQMAEQTAHEMAEEKGVPADAVWEDEDMAAQLKEIFDGTRS